MAAQSQAATTSSSSSSNRYRLIITADDFGYSLERDRGIVECFQDSAVTGVVLLVNGETAEEACIAAKEQGIPVGLHLNLTEGYPVHRNEHRTSLVNTKGFLRGKFGLRQALTDGIIDLKDVSGCRPWLIRRKDKDTLICSPYGKVRNEIAAQIERFQTLMGALPTHVDGHQHVHVLPGVCEVFAEILAKYGIGRTRLPIQRGVSECDWLTKQQMDFFQLIEHQAEEAKTVFQTNSIRYPDGFFGTSTMGSHMTLDHLEQALPATNHHSNTSPLTFEFMTHPGYRTSPDHGGCGDGPDDFSRSEDREHEMNILRSCEWKQIIATNNFDLCSYKDLK